MIKRLLFVVLILVLIGLAGYTLAMIDFQPKSAEEVNRITVSYRAEGEFDPDLAIIVLGVETSGKELELAYRDNNNKMKTVVNALQGMEGLSVKTFNFQVIPFNRREGEQDLTEYRVLNQLEVRTEQLAELSLIMQQAINSGANQVLSINYQLKDLTEAKATVISQALDGIDSKIAFIANKLDGQDYQFIAMDINDQGLERHLANVSQSYGRSGVMSETGTLPPLAAPKIKVVVNINATYAVSVSDEEG